VTHTNHQRASTGENSIRCSDRTPRCTLSGSPSTSTPVLDVRLGVGARGARRPDRRARAAARCRGPRAARRGRGAARRRPCRRGPRSRSPGRPDRLRVTVDRRAREVRSRASSGRVGSNTRASRRPLDAARVADLGRRSRRTARRAAPRRSARRRSRPSRACGARRRAARTHRSPSSGSSVRVRFSAAAPGSRRAVSSDGRLASSGVSASASAARPRSGRSGRAASRA
jgi:hypothetical protein